MRWPNFRHVLRGIGSTLNIFPSSAGLPDAYLSPEERDAKALAGDWQAVGDDLRGAIRKFEEKHPEIKRK